MQDKDKKEFVEHLVLACDYYALKQEVREKVLSKNALLLFFNLMSDFTIDEFKFALQAHMKKSQFMPKASDLIALIDGGDLSPDQIIGAARNPVDVLGVLARLYITKHDLDHGNSFHLRERAQEFKQLIPDIKKRLRSGQITGREAACLHRRGINPLLGFVNGCAPMVIPNLEQKAVACIEQTERRLDGQMNQLLLGSPDTSSVTPEEIQQTKRIHQGEQS